MTRVAAAAVLALLASAAGRAEEREPLPIDWSASVLYWNGGELKTYRTREQAWRPEVRPDAVLKGAVDYRLWEHFAFGVAVAVAAPRDDFRPAFVQSGCALRFPFEISSEVAIVPGVETGWRMMQEVHDSLGTVHGFALDANVRLSVDKDLGVVPFCEFGFLSQPFGGRGDLTVIFSPTMFVGGGLQF